MREGPALGPTPLVLRADDPLTMANAADTIIDSLTNALRPGLSVSALSEVFARTMADLAPLVAFDDATLARCEENPAWVRTIGAYSNGAGFPPAKTLRKATDIGLNIVNAFPDGLEFVPKTGGSAAAAELAMAGIAVVWVIPLWSAGVSHGLFSVNRTTAVSFNAAEVEILRRAKAAPISSRRLASCAGQRSVQRDAAPFEQFGQRPFAIRPAANRGEEESRLRHSARPYGAWAATAPRATTSRGRCRKRKRRDSSRTSPASSPQPSCVQEGAPTGFQHSAPAGRPHSQDRMGISDI